MSLRRVVLRNFVLVRELEVEFHEGFTVLTGETGAGKSILIDALALALGERADSSTVREGQARADITAVFDWPAFLADDLLEAGIEPADELLLRRAIDRTGGSRAWINGVPSTVQQLRDIGSALIALHGQHAWQALTRPGLMRGVLDGVAGVDRAALSAAWHVWRRAAADHESARLAAQARTDEIDRLQWQAAEVEKLGPGADEWAALNDEHRRLAHAHEVIDGLRSALAWVDGADDETGGAARALARAQATVQALARLDGRLSELDREIQDALARVQDVGRGLQVQLAHAEPDPGRLAALDSRLGAWVSLARRFRVSPADLAALLQKWKLDIENLRSLTDLEALKTREVAAQAAFLDVAQGVSRQRGQAAAQLAQAVTTVLPGLGMPGGRFEVGLLPLSEAAAHGLEDVEFRLAGHAGAQARPIARTASGGELSRVALAIAVCSSAQGSAQTLIFDEVDAGIGGSTATLVGRLLRTLGTQRQVLAVTHMAQVAACAHQQLRVTKVEPPVAADDPPESHVEALDATAREDEIARMLGGAAPGAQDAPSHASRVHARDLLHDGNRSRPAASIASVSSP